MPAGAETTHEKDAFGGFDVRLINVDAPLHIVWFGGVAIGIADE